MVKHRYTATALPVALYFTEVSKKNDTSKYVVCILLYAEKFAAAV